VDFDITSPDHVLSTPVVIRKEQRSLPLFSSGHHIEYHITALEECYSGVGDALNTGNANAHIAFLNTFFSEHDTLRYSEESRVMVVEKFPFLNFLRKKRWSAEERMDPICTWEGG
jgi:hypothetical protein